MPEPYYEHGGITIYHADAMQILPEVTWRGGVIVTDPPYGVSYGPRNSNRPAIEGERYFRRGSDRESTPEDTILRDSALAVCGDIPVICFGAWRVPKPPGTRWCIVWDKGRIGLGGYGPWRPSFEEIYLLNASSAYWEGQSAMPSVLTYPPVSKRVHPNEKPLGLLTTLLKTTRDDGDVIDPFMGSGATLQAARDLGRKAIGIEIEEKYCEIAAKRLAQEVLPFH